MRFDEPDRLPDQIMPMWWFVTRRVIIFGLGVAVIIDSLTDSDSAAAKLLFGLLLIGFPSIEDIARVFRRPELAQPRERREREGDQ